MKFSLEQLGQKVCDLQDQVKKLEYVVYGQWIEDCPRCHNDRMNESQKDVCAGCAYQKGDKL